MVQTLDINGKADVLRQMLQAHLGVGGRDLATAVRRARRLLPRAVRRQAEVIVRADELSAHPKLQMRLDPVEIDAAYETVRAHLAATDRADMRRGKILLWAGGIAFHVLLVAGLFIFWLWWKAYI
jgi:hypothetical protein